jgi:hypothetical protein
MVNSKEFLSYDTLTWMTLPVRRLISTPTVGLSEVSQLASEDGFQKCIGSVLVDPTKANYPPTTITSERKMSVVRTVLQEVRVVDLTKAIKIKVGV